MEEIKVGEYVRTADGLIGKLEQINKEPTDDTVTYIVTDIFCGMIEEIVKHSSNPIDLIEVGDYVNGYLVAKIEKDEGGNITDVCYEEENEMQLYSVGEIKSIVTKEVFQSVEYNIGQN